MSGKSIYEYESPRQFLLDWLNDRQKADPSYSARKFATEMGISHTLLIFLLQGKRPIRFKHAPSIAKALKLPTAERLYFQTLIEYDAADSPEEKEFVRLWLSELNPGREYRSKELDEYQIVADWIHYTILTMTGLKDFKGTEEEIHERLGKRATIHEVRGALQRLESLQLAKRDENGILRATYQKLTTKDDVASRGAKEYHKNAAEMAKLAVDDQNLPEREFQSFSISIDREKIPFAKELIRKFRAQFVKALESTSGTDVYHLNLHFFRLTESQDLAKAKSPRTKASNPRQQTAKEETIQ